MGGGGCIAKCQRTQAALAPPPLRDRRRPSAAELAGAAGAREHDWGAVAFGEWRSRPATAWRQIRTALPSVAGEGPPQISPLTSTFLRQINPAGARSAGKWPRSPRERHTFSGPGERTCVVCSPSAARSADGVRSAGPYIALNGGAEAGRRGALVGAHCVPARGSEAGGHKGRPCDCLSMIAKGGDAAVRRQVPA